MPRFFTKPFDFHLLPDDLKRYVLDMLDNPKDLIKSSLVCKEWKKLSNSAMLWNKYGFSSKEEFITFMRMLSQINQRVIEIYFLGYQEKFKNVVPIARWLDSFDNQLTTILESLILDDYCITSWNIPKENNDKIFTQFKEIIINPVIALAFISEKKEMVRYQQLIQQTGDNTLLIFVTDNENLLNNQMNFIRWNALDDSYNFYRKLFDKIKSIATLMGLNEKKEKFRFCSLI